MAIKKLKSNIRNIQEYKAFSLIELLIALGLFILILTTLSITSIDSLRAMSNTESRTEAYMQMSEISNLLIQSKSDDWTDIILNTDGVPKHIDIINNELTFVDGSIEQNGVVSWIEITTLERDPDGNIVDSGGTVDPFSRTVTIYLQWTDPLGQINNISKTLYINDWNTLKWTETTESDFDSGTHYDTQTVATDDGEVVLATVFYPDWCNPTVSLSEYNIPGSADSRSIFAKPDHAYLGTRGETSGEPFTKLNIEGVNPPTLTVEGTYNGYTVNDIFVVGNYAFLATTNDSKEVLILDVSSTPYTEIGYYNAGGSTDGYSVFVDGDVGYLAQGRYIKSFDTSSYIGSRSEFGSIKIGWWWANVSQIYVYEDYLYAVLNNDWYELDILNVANPSSMSITSQNSVNNQQVLDMYVNDDATRAYFGTNASSSEDEFFILDISNKNIESPIIASLDLGGMSVKGLAVVENEDIVIVVGTSGEEYQVYNAMDKSAPYKCGGMDVNTGIYDVDSNLDAEGNAFSYIVTGDADNEFKIMRGGAGGGVGNGYGYIESGQYVSSVFDTEATNTLYYYVSWFETTPALTDIKLQLRSANSSDMAGAVWIGPDGTSSTYFTNSIGSLLPNSLNSNRYIQYKAYLTGDTIATPELEEINMIYHN